MSHRPSWRWFAAGFAWGLAEATLLPLVPDVLVSAASLRGWRAGASTLVGATVGGLVGGTILWASARWSPVGTLAVLDHVPAVAASLVERVGDQVRNRGGSAVVSAPLHGVPYKLYAAQWGAEHRSLWSLLAWTVPARLPRFAISVLATRLLVASANRWSRTGPWSAATARRVAVVAQVVAAATFWALLYTAYFSNPPT